MLKIIEHDLERLNLLPRGINRDVNLRSTKRHVILEVMVDHRPVCIVKFPRSDEEVFLENEAAVLEALGQADLCTGSVVAPKLLYHGTAFGRSYLIMSFLPGEPPQRIALNGTLGPAIIDWLARMASVSQRSGDLRRPVDELLARVAVVHPEIENAVARAGDVIGRYAPVTMHGDASYNNLLVDGENIGIVDWEYANVNGFPMADAVDFLLYDLYRNKKNYRAAAGNLFFGNAPIHAGLLLRYCDARAIARADIASMFVLFVLMKLDLLIRLSANRSSVKARELIQFLSDLDQRGLHSSFGTR